MNRVYDLTEGSIGTAETQTISSDPEAWTDVTKDDEVPADELPDEPDEGTVQDEPEGGEG